MSWPALGWMLRSLTLATEEEMTEAQHKEHTRYNNNNIIIWVRYSMVRGSN